MTDRATIRLATAADAAAIAEIYAPYVTSSPISFETDAPDAAEMARRIDDAQRTHAWLVFDEDGVVGGYAYGSKHRLRAAYRWSVEVSVYIAEPFRRRRIAQALYTSLFRLHAAQHFVNAYAGITLPNVASVALHESLGFVPIGVFSNIGYKMGAWHDVGWWQRSLQSHSAAPTSPRSVVELDPREVDALLASGLPLVRAARAAT